MSPQIERSPASRREAPWPAARRGLTLVEALVAVAVIALLIALLLPAISSSRWEARRSKCGNNLKLIAHAILAYQGEHHALPPAYTVDPEGRPLHSWRTLILPHLDLDPLDRTIDLSKPWNDPANAEALATAPEIFHCPESDGPIYSTTYLGSVGPAAALAPDRPRPLAEITDDLGSTLLVIEVGEEDAVPWMAPNDADDALVRKSNPQRPHHYGGVNAAGVDDRIRFMTFTTPERVRRALTTIAKGDDAVVKDP